MFNNNISRTGKRSLIPIKSIRKTDEKKIKIAMENILNAAVSSVVLYDFMLEIRKITAEMIRRELE
jgi:uncharacterized protein with PQ loop repeat